MRGEGSDHAMNARHLVSRHAVDGADERLRALAKEVGDARRLLNESVKKVEQLAESIDNATRFLERAKEGWKRQRAGVIPALRAAQELASRISGEPVEEESY